MLGELTRPRVLTMTFEEGINGTQRDAITAAGIDTRATAVLISRAFCAQTFSHGFVHCDPHAANVLVRRGDGAAAGNAGGGWRARARRWLRGAGGSGAEAPQLVLLDHGLYREVVGRLLRACQESRRAFQESGLP